MKQKRTHYEIFWEILTHCKKPKSFTNIINRCNLNSKIGQDPSPSGDIIRKPPFFYVHPIHVENILTC